MVSAGVGLCGGILFTEVMVPIFLLCWLCCWPEDSNSDSSSTGKHPKKPVITHERGSRRRSACDIFTRRGGSSRTSLHLPSTSGNTKLPLSSHRSHEEISRHRRSRLEVDEDGRYHSAPSIIDEVLHRRDWERSARDLVKKYSDDTLTPDPRSPPYAEPESSSIEDMIAPNSKAHKPCKKHHKNIKSSDKNSATSQDTLRQFGRSEDSLDETGKTKDSSGKMFQSKELSRRDSKDEDETEIKNFYIGDLREDVLSDVVNRSPKSEKGSKEEARKPLYKAKDAKQSFNESIRTRKNLIPVVEHVEAQGFALGSMVEDRSGAVHHSDSMATCVSFAISPASVEPAGYESGACYLSNSSEQHRLVPSASPEPGGGWCESRGRHASDGDILAPMTRPESGAFSESDLDLDLELLADDEQPPPYCDLVHYPHSNNETAI